MTNLHQILFCTQLQIKNQNSFLCCLSIKPISDRDQLSNNLLDVATSWLICSFRKCENFFETVSNAQIITGTTLKFSYFLQLFFFFLQIIFFQFNQKYFTVSRNSHINNETSFCHLSAWSLFLLSSATAL